jgi:CheY-like chemotaxis protein
VRCIIVAEDDRDAHTWRSYLTHCGVSVEASDRLSDAFERIGVQAPASCVLVTDRPLTPAMRGRWQALAAHHRPGLVLIGEGLRRKPRVEDERTVSLDIDAMHRDSLVQAVRAVLSEHQDSVPCSATRVSAVRPAEPIGAGRQAQQILVAEDNDINRKVLGRQLDLLGLGYDMAVDGAQALERWQQGGYALLLTDLHMPELDGYMLTERIRQAEPAGQHLPIIAVTANALHGEDKRCLAAGMDDYIVKPVQLDELRRVILRWLPDPPAALDSAVPPPQARPSRHVDSLDAPTITVAPEPYPTRLPDPAGTGRAQVRSNPIAGLPVLDTGILASLIGDDAALIDEFLVEYRASARSAAGEILQARAAGDWKAVGDTAHRLKSASRSVGAMRLGELCAALEHAGRNHDHARLAPLLKVFELALEQTLRAIDAKGVPRV